MKVSISKFYKEVTGKTTVNRGTCTAALERWGVPFDELNGKTKGDSVDISHLESAKKIYATEAKRQPRQPKTPALIDDKDFLELLVRLDDNITSLQAKANRLLAHFKLKE